ncbi:hypothetical protein L288_10950 [Sphingobium quisquiliarum P25]|uniref:Uncharacterized protein n=1 Tax=Sphingobium quisquiliarum P25 TaxID=1329909 RepID=T0H339_9SPHN|nr:hypothetical protein [Sphingobium quisquiliarum]EQB06518.1 hypothetical protein L288_10950 [Sphingobium quisquiliarum P25]
MIRTLIFGAIAGYVGKKLYDEGKLTEFKDDLVSRYNQARNDISNRSAASGASSGSSNLGGSDISPAVTSTPSRPATASSPAVS